MRSPTHDSLARIIARTSAAVSPIRLGSVAAILDKWGGVRVSVTTDDRTFSEQVVTDRDERAYVVPGYLEPMYVAAESGREDGIPRPLWDRSAVIVETATAHMEAAQPSPCGACRACCKTLFIADEGDGFTKPSHTWCRNICGTGCGIYETRPNTCRVFECYWLKSQRGNRPMALDLRPDRSGAILTDHEDGPIRVHVDQSRPKSTLLQIWMDAAVEEGDRFVDVTHYYGER